MNTIITHDSSGTVLGIHVSECNLTQHLAAVSLEEGQSCIEVDGFKNINLGDIYMDVFSTPIVVREKESLVTTVSKTTIISDGVDATIISNIPQGVFVTWPDGQRDEVTDGVVEFSATQPDTYVLKFDGVKYLSKEVSIEAHV